MFLQVVYDATSVSNSEYVTFAIDTAKTAGTCPSRLNIVVQRSTGDWLSDKTEVDVNGNVIEVNLLEGKPNSFKVLATDDYGTSVEVFPSEFTIIQGIKTGAAPLTNNIGVGVYSPEKKRAIFIPAKGLEKNKPLPAVGRISDMKTTQALRPGNSEDKLMIPVYQGGQESIEKTASLNKMISTVIVTGDEVDAFIPEKSEVDITLHADSSEMMSMEIYFPAEDVTIKKTLDLGHRQTPAEAKELVRRELRTAQCNIDALKEDGIDTEGLQADLKAIKELVDSDIDILRAQKNLMELLQKIEGLEDGTEWDRVEKELRHNFDRLEKAQADFGNDKTQQLVNQLRTQTDAAIRSKDPKLGRAVKEQVYSLFFQLTLVYQCMGVIEDCSRRFSAFRWKDAARARQLVNRGMELISGRPTTDELLPIAQGLVRLMPADEVNNAGGLLTKGDVLEG